VIEELEGHIYEKAFDLTKKERLKKPDKRIYEKVITDLGAPIDVILDYLKVLPKRLTRGIKLFFLIQAIIGLISIIFGCDQVFYSFDVYNQGFVDSTYFLGMITAGIVFIFIGIILLGVIYFQLKRAHLIVQYGAFSAVLSLTLSFGTLLIMLDFILWRYTNLNYSMDMYYASLAPLLILIVIVHVVGLQSIERLQRRFALEDIDGIENTIHTRKSKMVMVAIALVTLALISMIFFSMVGYEWVEGEEKQEELLNSEYIGGKYDATLELWYDYHDGSWYERYEIKYTANGEECEGWFDFWHRSAFDWINNNTEENAVILSWWDYGHSIRGYTGREVILDSPSKTLENSIYDPSTVDHWEEDENKVTNVASAFIATNPSETVQIMEQYNATYIFTTARDRVDILYAFFMGTDLDLDEYFDYSDQNYIWNPKPKGKLTTIYKMWSGADIDGLELVYVDIDTKIYKLV
jgi:hypothetical protein